MVFQPTTNEAIVRYHKLAMTCAEITNTNLLRLKIRDMARSVGLLTEKCPFLPFPCVCTCCTANVKIMDSFLFDFGFKIGTFMIQYC